MWARMPQDTTNKIVRAVCAELNAVSEDLYSSHIRQTMPLIASDVLAEPSAYRTHADARAIAAIIMRKHILLPFSFDEQRAPTYVHIARELGLVPGGKMVERLIGMCEQMRRKPAYRKAYVGAVRSLIASGMTLHNTANVETTVPCQ